MFRLDMISDLHFTTTRLTVDTLNQASLGIVSSVTLLNVRAGPSVLGNFNQDQIDTMISYLSTD